MTFVTAPKPVDIPYRFANAPFVTACRMWSERLPIEVIPKCSIKSEPIAVHAHHGHDFSQPPLDIRTPSEQMDRTFEESRGYHSATITRWNAVPKNKFLRNVAIELILQARMFWHNDDSVAIETQFPSLIQSLG